MAENWCKVIFSDETQVVIGKNRKVYVWRKDEEKYQPWCVGQSGDFERKSAISVMFWGCICFNGVGTLTEIEGNIDSNKYISTIDTYLWPVVARHFPGGRFIFQEDNAPCHTSKASNKWKEDNQIETLDWPSQSPDLNIIENVWRKLKVEIEKKVSDIKDRQTLIRVVKEIWTSLTPTYIESLYNTIPARISAVVKAKGHITRF